MAARAEWLDTFKDAQQRIEADESDFLRAEDSEGERLDFHSLRHTCASWLIAAGADVKTVQSVMRHSDIRLTLDRYGHLFPGKEAAAIDLLGEVFNNRRPFEATGTVGASSALHSAQHSGCETVRIHATEDEGNQKTRKRPETTKPLGNEALEPDFQGFEEGSGGGTRTPDTRIMIPLL